MKGAQLCAKSPFVSVLYNLFHVHCIASVTIYEQDYSQIPSWQNMSSHMHVQYKTLLTCHMHVQYKTFVTRQKRPDTMCTLSGMRLCDPGGERFWVDQSSIRGFLEPWSRYRSRGLSQHINLQEYYTRSSIADKRALFYIPHKRAFKHLSHYLSD